MEPGSGIDSVTAGLTLEDKISLLAGADVWRTRALPDAGVPAVAFTDGPSGVRGPGGFGVPAASFPAGVALGATWDPDLVAEVGAALAGEVRTKRADVLLAPTVNLHRTPLAGRNFECYAEDPWLTARLAVAFIRGVQDAGVGACVKHFVANDSEFERMTISSDVDERTLRELYLLPFERAVVEADVAAVMAAYNRVNGTYATEHRGLLVDLLKEEWGFAGPVISDWFAVHDACGAANGGTDLEMPGPGQHFNDTLREAVARGDVDQEVIDDKVRRLLRLVARWGPDPSASAAAAPGTGASGNGSGAGSGNGSGSTQDAGPVAVDRPEHRALARRAAAAGMVLLRNDPVPVPAAGGGDGGPRPVLPLTDPSSAGAGPAPRLAVLGPNAAEGAIGGGGSSAVKPHYVVSALDGIRERAGDRWTVVHEPGPPNDRYAPEPDRTWFEPLDEHGRGLLLEYFDGDEPVGEPVSSRTVPGASHVWWGPPPGVTSPERFAARWTGRLVPHTAGPWRFGIAVGEGSRARLFVDGELVVDRWAGPAGSSPDGFALAEEAVGVVDLERARAHEVRIELSRSSAAVPVALRVGMAPVPAADALDRAVAAAADAEVAVVVVGTSADWEKEGADRVSMRLPGSQDELVRRVAAANPRTVVVVNTGSPVEMPWADEVAAIVQLWLPGQELGHALADVLFGDVDPGGRLPTTFPVRYQDHPALFGYPGESGHVRYGEGVFMGYRGYLARELEPRFPFGHGLSYTTFAHRDLRVEPVADLAGLPGPHGPEAARRPPAVAEVHVEVANTGDRAGVEVVQLFVGPPPGPLARPPLELKGFAKVALGPGERRTVTLPLDVRSFAAFDPLVPGWRAEAGPHVLVVASSGRPVLETTLELPSPIVLPVRPPSR